MVPVLHKDVVSELPRTVNDTRLFLKYVRDKRVARYMPRPAKTRRRRGLKGKTLVPPMQRIPALANA